MIIQWFLYGCLFIYCLTDYYQTTALLKCGFEEFNPIVLWTVQNGSWGSVLYYKLFMLIVLGVFLGINQFISRRVK